jgi:hypothetical protein
MFVPQIPFYKKLGEVCAKGGIGLDLFACTSNFIDLATLGILLFMLFFSRFPRKSFFKGLTRVGDLVKVTGGQCYLYPAFSLQTHGEQLYRELFRNFTREAGYDGLLRMRTSTGISQCGESGHFLSVNETDLMLGTVSADSAVYFEFSHDEKLKDNEGKKPSTGEREQEKEKERRGKKKGRRREEEGKKGRRREEEGKKRRGSRLNSCQWFIFKRHCCTRQKKVKERFAFTTGRLVLPIPCKKFLR